MFLGSMNFLILITLLQSKRLERLLHKTMRYQSHWLKYGESMGTGIVLKRLRIIKAAVFKSVSK